MCQSSRIYHNPRCSKSRATLALLEAKGEQADIVHYLETPPDRETLVELLEQLGLDHPRLLMRQGESIYKELDLANEALSPDDLLTAMLENPLLIERPIVVKNGKAMIGRPPEAILDIL
ncbi:MAG: arsenate reductase (glutaredoxin) [Cocleimonas sp.]|nr:arsenate reductase (glutaredoxin) [Cocleimonas sp.]